jgi:hypothetical protein
MAVLYMAVRGMQAWPRMYNVIVSRRLFDVLPSRVELEIVKAIDTPQATHIRYRVRRAWKA